MLSTLGRSPLIWVFIACAAVALAWLDYRGRRFWAIGLVRQTNPRWRSRFGPRLAALLWGWDLGLGFTTVRVTSLFWLAVLLVIGRGSAAFGAFVLATYGLALLCNLIWGNRHYTARGVGPASLFRLVSPSQTLAIVLLIGWGVTMLGLALAAGLVGTSFA
jgi:hypothetical protein